MSKIQLVVLSVIVAAALGLAGFLLVNPGAVPTNVATGQLVRIKTRHGDMVIKLRPELAPKTVENFKTLVGKGFYNGLKFHRVVRDFMIQGGDPAGDGSGGPGYTIKAEFSNTEHHKRGTVAMARSNDPDSAGSQFYIVHGDASFLDGKYTIFGDLVSGFDVLDKIATAPVRGETPVDPVKMDKVTLEGR